MSTETTRQPEKKLTKEHIKTLGLSSLGGTLEFYDFVIFVFFTSTLGPLFFPSDNEFLQQINTLGVFAAGYLARPVGGIIMAHFGDTIGRKKMFTLSIFLMAFPTLMIGVLPTYEQIGVFAPILLVLMRILQGAAIGGEMPGAWVFIAEHTPKHRYGFGIGTLTSGITGGILLGSLISIAIQRTYTKEEIDEFAWRIPFILGGAFGFISVYLRRYLEETPVFKSLQAEKKVAQSLPIKTVFSQHLLACGITAIMTWTLSTAIVVIILMTPNSILGSVHKIDKTLSIEANALATLMLSIGCIFWGVVSDVIGTTKTALIGFIGLIISSYVFYSGLHASIGASTLMFNYCILGFFVGIIVLTPIISTRAFPPEIRFSGLSSAYNLAYGVFGGVTPVFTIWLLSKTELAAVWYISWVSLLAISISFIPLAYKGYKHQQQN
ncbi:MFS transporter [Thorsellia kenyensis]|uniref:MFS transporter n=1 Tax=Thorsellia kenyensis TaxID=1549888 RepID=A0ABV6CDP4_9GAMM